MLKEPPIAALGLIPHRPPMLAVDTLVRLTADEAVTETVISAHSIFVAADGRLQEATLFEMMAQTLAVMMAAKGHGAGASAGYLVGLKRVSFRAPARVGSKVIVRVKIISQIDDFFVVEGEAHQEGQLLAGGQITVFVPGRAL